MGSAMPGVFAKGPPMKVLSCLLSPLVAIVLLWSPALAVVRNCPFCAASASMTFGEEFRTVDAVVLAQLVEAAPLPAPDQKDFKPSKFKVLKAVKGAELLPKADASGTTMIDVLFFGKQPPGSNFVIMGTDPNALTWSTPVPVTKRGVEYMSKLLELPTKGADRLAYFQQYLEDKDELLARDAYDEFARAPYAEVKELKPRMNREQLIKWIQDPEVSTSHRRLYLTLLGVCGKREDADMLEKILTTKTEEPRLGLDAMIACYLTLKGPDGVKIVEEQFLGNADADYTETYAAIMAIRFHGEEEAIIPRERLLAALRLMLDRPSLADLVIPDLARWQDWSVADKLVELFKKSDEKTSWVRVPVVQYLKACPNPEAEKMIAELEKIDAESVRRANLFLPLGAKKPGTDKPATETPAKEEPAKETPASGGKEAASKDTGAKSSGGAADAGGK